MSVKTEEMQLTPEILREINSPDWESSAPHWSSIVPPELQAAWEFFQPEMRVSIYQVTTELAARPDITKLIERGAGN